MITQVHISLITNHFLFTCSSVADPDVFGSGSNSQRYGSGSGSLYHQAKIVRNTFLPTVMGLLFDLLYLKNVANVPVKKISRKTV